MAPRESPRPRPRERRHQHEKRRSHSQSPRKARPAVSSESSSQALSADTLAKLNQLNQQQAYRPQEITPKKTRRKREREVLDEKIVIERARKSHKRKKRRVVSGALLEEGSSRKLRGLRGGDAYEEDSEEGGGKSKKKLFIGIGAAIVVIIIIIVVAVVVSNNNKNSSSSSSSSSGSSSSTPDNSNLGGVSETDIPTAAKGTYLDPFSWYDTTDFNVTYTNETVGGLPIMGLYSDWDDGKSANQNTPTIDTAWGSYETRPARGVNLGGWLSLEPFITPSLFNYDTKLGIVDEYTLCTHLGTSGALATLEKHYATFVTEDTFKEIAAAGLDHVRIPFSYWAVTTYDNDPYVFRTSWRYLLRAIEWARQHGIRVNLDLHALPGSQNGWTHSGRLGAIGWLNGTDGTLNAQRSLEIHDQLSKFFAQDRYKNIIAFYGLANEPKMTALTPSDVEDWTTQAFTLVRKNGINAYVVFGDGFMGLDNWQGVLQGYDGLVLDVHQYVIFNNGQIAFNHTGKVEYACTGWTEQAEKSLNVATGFGPTIFAEWSQADTDCAPNLNNIGAGTRWEGDYDVGDAATAATTPMCPTAKEGTCSCADANADPAQYSAEYKEFLQMFAEAQMHSFETGWGWFYWTWQTEAATQWSYKLGLAAGILPKLAYKPEFNCTAAVPDFKTKGLEESY
ncbi:beta-glucosidase 6 [Phlyctema vagabunda]|uniref:glucan 1,3-beta-glucosidase n=1 Tax=Phlyctema vagabunda TaxID=108571 RepID=A0ABR4PDV5_9HELO